MNDDNANQVEVGEGPKAADTRLLRIVRAREAAHAALAEVDRIAETEGPQAADAFLQRIARAREAQASEALAPSDIESALRLLDDLELGDEPDCEVIEHLDELDAYAEDTAKAKAEASVAPTLAVPVAVAEKPKRAITPELLEKLRASRIKYNGGVEVAKYDPLAKDKKRASNALKKVGRALGDLPLDFWMLPRFAKMRSRQSEFLRVFREGEEEMREAERLRELEKRGRPANYDLLSWDERHRIDVNARQRRHRDKKPKPPSKPTSAPLPVANAGALSSGGRHGMSRSLYRWTRASSTRWTRASSSPLARQLRKPEQQHALIRAAAAYAWYFDRHSKPPSRSDLAKMLRCTKDQARRKLDVLKSLYAPGGPWAGA